MKYAFVVLIAIYLITYGCSSGEQKPETKSPKKAETITVENVQPAAPAIAAEQAVQVPGEPAQPAPAKAPAEQPALAQQPEKAMTEPQPGQQPQADSQQQPLADEQDTFLINPEDLVIMPCGRAFIREDVPCDLPCMQQQDGPMMEEGPMVQEDQAMPQTMPGQLPAVTTQDELTAAMRNMVEATNAMVEATRQMTIATEEMLKATRGAAGEAVDSAKEGLKAEEPKTDEQPAQPTAPTGQTAQPQAQVPASAQSPTEAVVESLKDVVVAAQTVVDASNKAVSQAGAYQHHQ